MPDAVLIHILDGMERVLAGLVAVEAPLPKLLAIAVGEIQILLWRERERERLQNTAQLARNPALRKRLPQQGRSNSRLFFFGKEKEFRGSCSGTITESQQSNNKR